MRSIGSGHQPAPMGDRAAPMDEGLPAAFANWFAARGWCPRDHQIALLQKARKGRSALLIAPTGAGKTLAGFLPSLIELATLPDRPKSTTGRDGLHTLYISPLKALAVDVARNLERPIAEIGLAVRLETRTGDTPAARRARQRRHPPQLLMTTPEQLALMLSHRDAVAFFARLRRVIVDEVHALVTSKRGDLLALGLARLRRLAPTHSVIGLSATVADPQALAEYLVAGEGRPRQGADIIVAATGARPQITIMETAAPVPWAGHSASHAIADIYAAIAEHRTTLVFVNTRSQAERMFQELWRLNDEVLPIALHHGSLDVARRRRVEAAMAAGRLRAVVCTSTLDLGIDWGDVDLVINVGAPKGASRIAQRIGRSNHRLDTPSRAILVPANRFEVIECHAALQAAADGVQDTPAPRRGGLDVLAQHLLGTACAGPFDPDALYREVVSTRTYRHLSRRDFDRVVDFVATGGYALAAYDRYARLRPMADGRFRLAHPRLARQYRLNVGTIVEAPMLKIRLVGARRTGNGRVIGRGGRVLGEMEESFIEQLKPGDTFLFAGEILRFETLRETDAYVSRTDDDAPMIPTYQGGKFPLSTYLADRVRAILSDPAAWRSLPDQVRAWLNLQRRVSLLPAPCSLLVETFPRGGRSYLVCYPFEGRLAHQTLGLLLTRRLERAHARPLGFVASEYALAIWGLGDLSAMIRLGRLDLEDLFAEDMLGDDLESWLAESSLMKRTFRNCAIIAGLIERRHPGTEKSGRQLSVSSDLVYDVLRAHDPGHVLLAATFHDAATGLLDIARLGEMLARISGRIVHNALDRVSPLAVPVLLDIGREPIRGEAEESILDAAADRLIDEARGACRKDGSDR